MKLKLVALLLIPHFIMGQTSFLDFAESEIVKSHIVLAISADSLLNYIVDDNPLTRYNILENKQLFLAKGNHFHIRMKYVNPLHYQISSSKRSLDDELFKATDKYLSDVISFLIEINKSTSPNASSHPDGVTDSIFFERSDPSVLDIYARMKISVVSNELFDLLVILKDINVQEAFQESIDTIRSSFQRLYNITQYSEVAKVLKTNESNMHKLNVKFSVIKDSIDVFEKRLKETLEKNGKDKKSFEFQYIRIGILNLREKLNKAQIETEETRVKYEKVKMLFESTKAINEELVILDIKISREKILYEVDILIKKIDFNFEKLTLSERYEKLYTLKVRKFHRIIPSVSTGAIYSSLIFKTFGTNKNALGETIVGEAEEEIDPLNFGTYLNLHIINRSEITPLVQFGVSTTRNKPALMLGLGTTYRDITLSLGGLWTWTPKLKTLSVGQIVSGTTQIDNDIKYSFRDKPYFYIGLSFNILKSN